jgi:hypothetical protein
VHNLLVSVLLNITVKAHMKQASRKLYLILRKYKKKINNEDTAQGI